MELTREREREKQEEAEGTKTDRVRRVRIFIVAEAILREPSEKVSVRMRMKKGRASSENPVSGRTKHFFLLSHPSFLLPSLPFFLRAVPSKNYQKIA